MRTREVLLQRLDGRREEILAAAMDDPVVELDARLAGLVPVRQPEGARRVVGEALAYDGVEARAVLADVLGLLVGEVVVAGPAWRSLGDAFTVWDLREGGSYGWSRNCNRCGCHSGSTRR